MTDGITMRVIGAEDVAAWLDKYGEDVARDVARVVKKTALKVDRRVKRAIQKGPKTGKVYTRASGQNMSRTHQASKKGEAPATDTGALVSSIYFKQVSRLSAEVGSRLVYAAALEWGTSRMDARPSWQPAVAAEMPDFEKAVEAALRGAAKK